MNSRDFYNTVCLMRAAQTEYQRLDSLAERTEAEEDKRLTMLQVALNFEHIIDTEIDRVQALLEKGGDSR